MPERSKSLVATEPHVCGITSWKTALSPTLRFWLVLRVHFGCTGVTLSSFVLQGVKLPPSEGLLPLLWTPYPAATGS
eukprot:381038-Amphidinium_carterae.1